MIMTYVFNCTRGSLLLAILLHTSINTFQPVVNMFYPERIIGFAQAARISGGAAEVAIAVADAFQHRGLGRLLLRRLAAEARQRQIRWFIFDAYPDNVAVWRLASKAGTGTRRMNGDGMTGTLVSLDGIEDEDGAIPCLAAAG